MSSRLRSPRLRAVGALLVLAAVIVGLPVGMLAVVGSPVPGHWPHWGELGSRLLSPDDGSLFLGFLVALFWAAYLLFWLGFTAAVVLEVGARVRRRSTPGCPGSARCSASPRRWWPRSRWHSTRCPTPDCP